MESRSHWKALATGDITARDALLTENLSLVHHVARQLERKLSNELDHDELVSAGTLGLMAAMNSFDPERGLAFSTFAVPRIRGAILDELRRQDHVPRSVRRKTRDIGTARSTLAAKLCRMPEDSEVAEALGVDVQTLWKWESDVEGAIRVPIDRSVNDRGETHSSPLDLLHTDPDQGADEQIGREQEVSMLREAIMKLKEQERTVLALYYFEELKLHEIAEILRLTESRVSQIRSKALARLWETVGIALASLGSRVGLGGGGATRVGRGRPVSIFWPSVGTDFTR
jgi:RNA polymerase sigma factor for flagellar operon FliA